MALAVLDTLFWQSRAVQAVAALCGLGVALAQGLILSKAKGVPAWNAPLMPTYFLTSALAFHELTDQAWIAIGPKDDIWQDLQREFNSRGVMLPRYPSKC